MATLTLAGQEVLSGTITQPRNGAWTADLQVAGEVALSGAVQLSDGTSVYNGSIASGAVFAGRGHWRVVGGKGGLGGVLGPKHYRSATVGRVLSEICSDSGENRSPLILPTVLLRKLSYWTRPTGTGGTAIANLSDSFESVWRILPNGDVWLGSPGFQLPAPQLFTVLESDPINGSHTIAIDDLSLWVGMSQEPGQISRIEYYIGDNARAKYWVS